MYLKDTLYPWVSLLEKEGYYAYSLKREEDCAYLKV
jgi:hypothetical protein